ncbi:hypothetical protein CHS0354_005939 [Potamilus streckersoni]|uniref:Thioredoxin domain-containing protein n=1 Tax=Potamilus streckersoni TaxID=2493646 RepID=A0AAE0SNP9_9BIVA|nr:hypothetical protein CHS0354_005939 [Potamilus streckersoni]
MELERADVDIPSRQLPRQRHSILSVCLRAMCGHPELLCFIVAGIVFLLARIGQSFHEKQLTIPAKPPSRFFPLGSSVLDFPFGNLQPAINLLEKEEFLFVMYYAAWSAESIELRTEFINAAKYHDIAKFVAINCWHPEGECRQRQMFSSYPEFYAYHKGVQNGYRFTGIVKAEYMVKFLQSLVYTLEFLCAEEEVKQFIAKHDNAVIGYFDFNASPQPPGKDFLQFYFASLRIVEYDLYQPIKFAVVTRKQLADYLKLEAINQFVFSRLGNSTIKYPESRNFTCSSIVQWLNINKQQPFVKWLVPTGQKSLILSSHVQKAPAVFVFGASNPLHEVNPFLCLVREVAMTYRRDCSSHVDLKYAIDESIQNRGHSIDSFRNLQKMCKQSIKETNFVPYYDSNCCFSVMERQKESKLPVSVCEYCIHKNSPDTKVSPVCDASYYGFEGVDQWRSVQLNSCLDFHRFYNVNEHRTLCCKQCYQKMPPEHFVASAPKGVRISTDSFVRNGARNALKRRCTLLSLQKVQKLISMETVKEIFDQNTHYFTEDIVSLQCRTNRTVDFYFMDSSHHSIYAERLGVHIPDSKQPAVILTDLKNEFHSVLREPFTKESLGNFVYNYTYSNTVRLVRSEPVIPVTCEPSQVCIIDVTAQNFQSVVMDPNKDVMLLFYATWCGFCNSFLQIYLLLAKYFQSSKNLIFARINADRNDLPWELTVDKYPTIIFFPVKSKSDSVMFPDSVRKTLPNLIKFTLHHAAYSEQLHTAFSLCSQRCVAKNLRKTKKTLHCLKQDRLRLLHKMLWLKSRSIATYQLGDLDITKSKIKPSWITAALQIISKSIAENDRKTRKAELLKTYLIEKQYIGLSFEELRNVFKENGLDESNL